MKAMPHFIITLLLIISLPLMYYQLIIRYLYKPWYKYGNLIS